MYYMKDVGQYRAPQQDISIAHVVRIKLVSIL